jgi:putative flippase GtrA
MLWLIQTVVRAVPAPLRRRIPANTITLLAQFLQFGVVGVIGFVVDTAVVYALRAPTNLYVAGVVAYLVAVTTTWWVNRIWTFQGISNIGPMHRQWVRYAVANIPGLLLNLGTYFALVSGSQLCADYPVLAVAAGAVAGMFANFSLARALVFR